MKRPFAGLIAALFTLNFSANSQPYITPLITTVAGNGSCCYTGDGGAATAAKFDDIQSVAADAAGNLYIGDVGSNRIRKVTPAGIVTTIAGTGTAGYSGDGGLATAAQVYAPVDMAFDKLGNLYFAEGSGNKIRKISTTGIITTVAGTGTSGHGGDGGLATAATFSGVSCIAVDTAGNLYIGEGGASYIRKVNTAGIITTIAGTSVGAGFSGDGGAATAARLNTVRGIVVDTNGNVYFSDNANSRIRKINPSGIISTVVGDGTTSYSGDGGLATAAKIHSPRGLTIGKYGHIFFADWGNQRVRYISPDGTISTLTGDGTIGFTGDGGLATAARIKQPFDVVTNTQGHLYIADNGNLRVRKVYPPTPAAISGTTNVCVAATTPFSDATAGGTWSSASSSIATVGSSTGIVSGVAGGSTNISYTLKTVCGSESAIKNIVVDTFPDAGAITGLDTVCVSETITLSNSVTGGVWSSSNNSLGSITGTGIVTGVAAGSVTISYSVTNSCGTDYALYPITIFPYEHCYPPTQLADISLFNLCIFPNPTDGLIALDLGAEPDNCILTIIDVSGRKVMDKALQQRMTTFSLNLSQGIYFATVSDKSGMTVKKIVIR